MIHLEGAGVVVETMVAGTRGTRTILHPVSLQLDQQRIAVVGANGSGKSTLLRLMNGLTHPTCGRVSVDGLDTIRDGAQVRRRVGFVFTDPMSQLIMATPLDDVELSLRRTVRDRTVRRARALEALDTQAMAHLAETSVHDLSGGERQLVALTSVLAVDPTVVVADEPTTLLDLRHRNRVQAALLALPQQVVVATHDLDFAAEFERVLVVDGGCIVADGPATPSLCLYRELMA